MDRENIIRMAHEAGLHLATDVNWMPIIGLEYAEKLVKLAAVKERQCLIDSGLIGVLKHCEDLLREDGHEDAVDDVQNMIAKIKAREA
jgi:hypothetical protein